MRFSGSRRDATRVRRGLLHNRQNWRPDPANYFALPQQDVRIDRRSPGPGFRHLVTVAQLRAFLDLLPDWDEVAVGLDAIVLDRGSEDLQGWHRPHLIGLRAWEQELWWHDCHPLFEAEHRAVLDRLGVTRIHGDEHVEMRWTEAQARTFQLLHVLPHELGHHHDRVTTRRRRRGGRGESYAEAYALRALETVWDAYVARFGFVDHIR